MPSRAEHIAQANSNLRFTETIDAETYPDWAITSMFYQAVHLVRAWLYSVGESNFRTHTEVKTLLRIHRFSYQLRTAYQDLETLSRDSRYECLHPDELRDDVEASKQHLAALWAYIEPGR